MAVGRYGWTGGALILISISADGHRTTRGRVWLEDGTARTDLAGALARWERDGVVGRSDRGRLYPRDGQAFIDELPFVYQGPYLHAVPDRSGVV